MLQVWGVIKRCCWTLVVWCAYNDDIVVQWRCRSHCADHDVVCTARWCHHREKYPWWICKIFAGLTRNLLCGIFVTLYVKFCCCRGCFKKKLVALIFIIVINSLTQWCINSTALDFIAWTTLKIYDSLIDWLIDWLICCRLNAPVLCIMLNR